MQTSTQTPTAQPPPATRLLGRLLQDRSALSLLLANLATIVVALIEGWSVGPLMWIYWAQSVIIGAFNVARILSLDEFVTTGMTINDRSVKPTRAVQRQTAIFFAIHYGFFHLIYLLFIGSLAGPPPSDALTIGVCIVLFLANHSYSFRRNRDEDRRKKPNIGTIMFSPYARIVPMHLTIIFASAFIQHPAALVFFVLLKTAADLVMHAVKHRPEKTSNLPG
ncbi:MAG: hypothetical protein KAY32_14175 [Candidatus Eisenbacteria sp.]|nr:hypothetical protein [Candidatus Eisenbacteria bacterium]